MITALHIPTNKQVEIVAVNNYLRLPRVEIRTLDESKPFLRLRNEYGARFYSQTGLVSKATLTDIRKDGEPVQ